MNFLKECHSKRQIVPSFPTGDGGVESVHNGTECIHPGVCMLDYPTFLIHFRVKEVVLRRFHETSFCNAQRGHNLFFYCIFVKYSVCWQLFSILKCDNHNIANSLPNALYFIYSNQLFNSSLSF